jgi:tetratricopeptide (TPR) repeat protein
MLRAAQAIDSESYSEWHRSRVLADEAMPVLPERVLKRSSPRVLRATTDAGARCRALAQLALRMPNTYLDEAARVWVESDEVHDEGVAMLAIARAARGWRREADIRRRLESRMFDVPGSKAYWRIKWIDHLARVVVVWGDRGAASQVLDAAKCDDIEYAAAAASRIALAFVEAGWIPEAQRAVEFAAERLRQFGEGYPLGEGDVNARLGLVMHRLGRSREALGYLRRALEVLWRASGSQSAFDEPAVMRQAIGVSLAEAQTPPDALQTIRDVVGPEPDDAADTLLGLFGEVLDRRGSRAASLLESAIEATGRGCGPWLRVRLAARWQAVGNRRLALTRLSTSLEHASQRAPAATLDVIQIGAGILNSIDSGGTLRDIYGTLRELQSWGAAAPRPQ